VGGLFLDGRAQMLEEQAAGPLLNPLEMNNASKAEVVAKVRAAPYAPRLLQAFGPRALDDVEGAFETITRALAAFERTPRFAPFSSRYDAFLAGRGRLSPKEARGLALFNDPKKGNCAACHPSTPSEDGTPPLFTDFTYDNLGVPRNPRGGISAQGAGAADLGLGGVLGVPAENGKFRVPTLRNVALTAPYMHNGVFESLEEVVRYYSTRDTQPWPAAEYPETVNREELGSLGLTEEEQGAIVAFLRTLTDGARP
jgi:cytochrome c peroxidase